MPIKILEISFKWIFMFFCLFPSHLVLERTLQLPGVSPEKEMSIQMALARESRIFSRFSAEQESPSLES